MVKYACKYASDGCLKCLICPVNLHRGARGYSEAYAGAEEACYSYETVNLLLSGRMP